MTADQTDNDTSSHSVNAGSPLNANAAIDDPNLREPTLQVGALPIRFEDGRPQVLLLTSRETRRWVIPKGWPMKGKKNWAAAAQEAKEEAGIVGKTFKKPIGDYLYLKRRGAEAERCRVEVYVLAYEKRLQNYREKGQRDTRWYPLDEAPDVVQEPGLVALLKGIDLSPYRKPAKKVFSPDMTLRGRKADKKTRRKA